MTRHRFTAASSIVTARARSLPPAEAATTTRNRTVRRRRRWRWHGERDRDDHDHGELACRRRSHRGAGFARDVRQQRHRAATTWRPIRIPTHTRLPCDRTGVGFISDRAERARQQNLNTVRVVRLPRSQSDRAPRCRELFAFSRQLPTPDSNSNHSQLPTPNYSWELELGVAGIGPWALGVIPQSRPASVPTPESPSARRAS